MRDPLLILTLLTATVGAAAPGATQVNNFHWSGVVERGNIVDIRGVNGSVRAVASGDGLVPRGCGFASPPQRSAACRHQGAGA